MRFVETEVSSDNTIIRQHEITTCIKNIIVFASILPIYVKMFLYAFAERALKKLEKSMF